MKEIPEDHSDCAYCGHEVRRHSAGATCTYCGRTQIDYRLVTEFQELKNGEMFIVPEYYPGSTHYDASETEKVVWIKAEKNEDFPGGRKHWRENAYRADKPQLRSILSPGSLVIPVKPLEGLLPTV